MNEAAAHLALLFQRNQTMDFASIAKAAGGRSRRSLFRDLASLGYLTSYTHAGRYHTLSDLPQFDEHGLVVLQGYGFFSRRDVNHASFDIQKKLTPLLLLKSRHVQNWSMY